MSPPGGAATPTPEDGWESYPERVEPVLPASVLLKTSRIRCELQLTCIIAYLF